MPQLKTQTFYDWSDIEAEVEAKTGRELRNWANWDPSGDAAKRPYQDFWHKLLDCLDIHNGAVICGVNFEEIRDYYTGMEEEEWVSEIIDAIQDVMGKDELDIRFWW